VIGRSIGNYKIVRVLGEGGMGTVYLAEHPMIGKRVAVKMLRPDLGADPGLVSRFFQEARAVNEIRHPNIVDISDFGHTSDGIVYFVMELMEGQSLREHLTAHTSMPLDQMLPVACQVCDALAAAHRAGIVHRDLKPDNIFLVNDPTTPGAVRAKLFDFGVAKLLGEQEKQVGHKTMAGSVVGTPFYMSPEQALCHDVTAASDIYSMGVVMYEMITGRLPFHAKQLVILLNAILKQDVPTAQPHAPAWLDRLLQRCLEKNAEERPRSMEEVIHALNVGDGGAGDQETALGATMAASVAVRRVSAQLTVSGRASQSRTTEGPRPSQPRITKAVSAQRPNVVDAPADVRPSAGRSAPRGTMDPPVARARTWLNSQRVRRVAVPVIVLSTVIVGLSMFLSHKADQPLPPRVETEAAPAPASTKVTLNLSSEPQGAEVTRINDGRMLGTTPLVDVRPDGGQQLNYRFHLNGFTDVQVPVDTTAGSTYEITATLVPVERRGGTGPTGRRGKGKAAQAQSAAAPSRSLPNPNAAPQPTVPEPAPTVAPSASSIPPLLPSVRVRRLGH
jgi:serine/threonine-protein kinase